MKIKINKKTHKIKPAIELTVKEYIDFFDRLKDKSSNLEMLICYVASVTGLDYHNVADIDMDNNTIRRLFAYIGEIRQAKDISVSTEFYHRKSGKYLYQKNVNWRSVGVRKLLEERKTTDHVELAVYLLAIYIAGNYDNEKIEEIYNELQDYNAIEVLGFAVFFFIKLFTGKTSGTNFLTRLMKKAGTRTVKLSSK